MRHSKFLSVALAILPLTTAQTTSSRKRGLCHVKDRNDRNDDKIWTSGPSNPTWYYNYGPDPSPSYASDKSLNFVPMLWGASERDSGSPFYDSIKKQIDAGANITHVLGFNEPDGGHSTGGSNLEVGLAARRWIADIEPLKKLGVKVGAPGVTGAESGWNWLDNWFKACNGGCNPDFMVVHWYGNYEGMMSHVGRVTSTWPNRTVWVTEYGYPNQGLRETQEFANASSQTFDRWPNITHYSYFGAFRSDVSNVGTNAAMLTESGQLTDIGSWYMGGAATNNVPKASGGTSSLSVPAFIQYVWNIKWSCLVFSLLMLVFLD